MPSTMYSVWPNPWACQAVRAPGANRTAAETSPELGPAMLVVVRDGLVGPDGESPWHGRRPGADKILDELADQAEADTPISR